MRRLLWFCLALMLPVTGLAALIAQPKRVPKAPARVVIPQIAHFAGVRVGFDTMEDLERRLGPGRAYTGGHPRGAREWRSRQTGWFVEADGFDYNRQGGRVIDSMSILSSGSGIGVGSSKDTPKVNAPSSMLRFQGSVTLGMSRPEVLRRLRGRLPKPTVKGDTLVWHEKGYYHPSPRNAPSIVYNEWSATLTFQRGVLVRMDAWVG